MQIARQKNLFVAACTTLVVALASVTNAQTVNYEAGQNGAPNGGQINISGATLFADFFASPASTNDFINADGDTVARGAPCNDVVPFSTFLDTNCDGFPDAVDQLAPGWTCGSWNGYWLVQYRSVGSVAGFGEFVGYQTIGEIPTSIPSEVGRINRISYAITGTIQAIGCTPANCDPSGPESGTPVCPTSIDIASTDVPTTWVVAAGSDTNGSWDRKPTSDGYGYNPIGSSTGFISTLESLTRDPDGAGPMPAVSLNTNFGSPDSMTVYDTLVAWSPVAGIANPGTGIENIRYTELQHLFVAGRLPNGENLAGATRDVGSGTRNAWANSLGIDPAWCRGDNLGDRIDDATFARVGTDCQPSNCGGSSIMEGAVQNWRLAIGFTGLAGSSRAAADAVAGRYEVINVCKDIDGDGDGFIDSDCSPSACFAAFTGAGCNPFNPGVIVNDAAPANNGYVRASIDTVLDNADATCGFQIGGPQTLSTVGDPESDGMIGSNPEMANLNARNYLRNITDSIAAFVGNPPASINDNMPGEYLANSFFLIGGVDAFPVLNPTELELNPSLNQALQDFIRCNNGLEFGGDTPAFGSTTVAGLVPQRRGSGQPTGSGFAVTYSDGSTTGSYVGSAGAFNLTSSSRLNHRNRIAGDFNYDMKRDISDISEFVKALANPRIYQKNEIDNPPAVPSGALPLPPFQSYNGNLGGNFAVPEIMGDVNGDGNFDSEDARYFADGLAIDPANADRLNRREAFRQLDIAWSIHRPAIATTPPGGFPAASVCTTVVPCWHPSLPSYLPAWPDAAVLGAAVADISGGSTVPTPGAGPNGHDGAVDGYDIDYVFANFGDWVDLNQAVFIDLSADMNGDLMINIDDVKVVVNEVLCTHFGDVNLDGVVDAADRVIVEDTILNGCVGNCGWAQGDMDGNGTIDSDDLDIVNDNQGKRSPCLPCTTDIDGNGVEDGADLAAFVNVLLGSSVDVFQSNRSDFNGDGSADGEDIQQFVDCLLGA